MAEFTPINTQAEFDALIADRIKRAEENARKPFADYEEVKKNLAAREKEIGELNGKIATLTADNKTLGDQLSAEQTSALRVRVALDSGLPYSSADRLRGTTEEEIKKDAEELVALIGAQKTLPAQLYNPEPSKGGNSVDAALAELAASFSEK